jgi:hypothetical protein
LGFSLFSITPFSLYPPHCQQIGPFRKKAEMGNHGSATPAQARNFLDAMRGL